MKLQDIEYKFGDMVWLRCAKGELMGCVVGVLLHPDGWLFEVTWSDATTSIHNGFELSREKEYT
jgi:hypothetical protein